MTRSPRRSPRRSSRTSRTSRTARTALLLCTAAAACGGDDTAGDPDAAIDAATDGAASGDRVGSIEVIEDRWVYTADAGGGDSRSATVNARFFQGREPRYHREAMRAGDCVLRTYEPASCTPACTTGLCVDTNVCEPFPTYVSAGRLTLTGLRTAVQIDPRDGFYYLDSALPPDLFADDAAVGATLAGATLPAMTLAAGAVAPITPDITGGKLVAPYPATGPLAVSWPPAGGDARVRLTLNANNRGHGQPYVAIIECEVADAAGRVEVPATLLDAFPATEAWFICAGTDCPPSSLRRYRRGTTAVGAQEVELVVASTFTFGLEHRRP